MRMRGLETWRRRDLRQRVVLINGQDFSVDGWKVTEAQIPQLCARPLCSIFLSALASGRVKATSVNGLCCQDTLSCFFKIATTGASTNTNQCLCWEYQVMSVDQQSVRGGQWIWWILSMGDILYLAVIHRQTFVVACLHFRTTLRLHKYLTKISPKRRHMPPRHGSLSKPLRKQLEEEKGKTRHGERREKAWHRD